MRAPDWVCEEVERINPLARIGWEGETQRFAVLDLYPKRLADVTFKTLWEGRGPVFGSDYDHLQRIPIWIDEVSVEDVFSGKVTQIVKRLCKDIQERLNKTWQEEQESQRRTKKELAGAMGSHMYWNSQKSLNATNIIADKHISKAEKAIAAGDVAPRVETAPSVHGIGLT